MSSVAVRRDVEQRVVLDSLDRWSYVIDAAVARWTDASIECHRTGVSRRISIIFSYPWQKTTYEFLMFIYQLTVASFQRLFLACDSLETILVRIQLDRNQQWDRSSWMNQVKWIRTEMRSFSMVSVNDFSRSSSCYAIVNMEIYFSFVDEPYFVDWFFIGTAHVTFHFTQSTLVCFDQRPFTGNISFGMR